MENKTACNRNQSLCHWTHSGVGEWLWRNVAGLNPDPDDPGYRSMTIRPQPTKEVHSCRSRYLSVRGAIEIEWAWRGGEFRLDIAVPVGARAKVFFFQSVTKTPLEKAAHLRRRRVVSNFYR
jgi:hypothetical protein